ncbi:ribosomal RNA small subunit methyltransferase A [bacterium]|nr:ribosomal RNA small subunit methyltransferase A [bacterium]
MGSSESSGSYLPRAVHGRDGAEISFRGHVERFGLVPDKRLGQHWLTSEKAIRAICDRADGLSGVLEIGPGPGVLTRPLIERVGRVTALDVDRRMVEAAGVWAAGAQVILADALNEDWGVHLRDMELPRGIFSNMPYNITGPLLDKVCEQAAVIDRAVLMMQREVGEKILAKAGDRNRGALSVVIQRLFDVTRVCLVPPGAFWPPPKVDSVVLDLRPRGLTGERAFDVVRMGFRSPRKTLVNNLSSGYEKDLVGGVLLVMGLSETVRPHELTEEAWFELAGRLVE